jgi:hypothetical protein
VLVITDTLVRMKRSGIRQRGEMREHIGAAIVGDDEAAAFGIAEPPHRTCFHARSRQSRIQRGKAQQPQGLQTGIYKNNRKRGERAKAQRYLELMTKFPYTRITAAGQRKRSRAARKSP